MRVIESVRVEARKSRRTARLVEDTQRASAAVTNQDEEEVMHTSARCREAGREEERQEAPHSTPRRHHLVQPRLIPTCATIISPTRFTNIYLTQAALNVAG